MLTGYFCFDEELWWNQSNGTEIKQPEHMFVQRRQRELGHEVDAIGDAKRVGYGVVVEGGERVVLRICLRTDERRHHRRESDWRVCRGPR